MPQRIGLSRFYRLCGISDGDLTESSRMARIRGFEKEDPRRPKTRKAILCGQLQRVRPKSHPGRVPIQVKATPWTMPVTLTTPYALRVLAPPYALHVPCSSACSVMELDAAPVRVGCDA